MELCAVESNSNSTAFLTIIVLKFFAGGVRPHMYSTLPRPLLSKSGFQGCIASFETNGELEDPIKHALVPSPLVEEGCEGKLMNKTFLLHIRTIVDRVAAAADQKLHA